MLLQSMCARLGIASGMDLAQVTKHISNKPLSIAAWIVTELAIMATDIAEVIGSAIALNLLLIYLSSGSNYYCIRCFTFTSNY